MRFTEIKKQTNKGVAEDTDEYGYHTRVRKGKFLPSKYGRDKNNLYLHDMDKVSGQLADHSGPQLVTIDNKLIATELAAMYGGYVEKTSMGTYRVYQPQGARQTTKKPELQGVAEGVTSPEIQQAYKDIFKTAPSTPERKRAVAHYSQLRKVALANKKQTKEGWESGPEEPSSSRERDPDDAYDDMRQQKADAEAERSQARRPQEKYYTLTGRGPKMEPNYAFPGEYDSLDAAKAARAKLMADPKTPNPRMIGIDSHTRYLDEAGIPPTGQHRIRSAKKFVSVAKQLGATIQDHGDELTAVDSKGIVIGEFSRDEMVGWIYAPTTNRSEFNEGIESGDPVESAVLSAVQELIQQGHTEVAPEVITNMVVAATSQPFLLKDLVDVNNNSAAVQHYVDSINPTKVKFSNEILTVKNEDPMKDKKQAQNGVAKMAAKAAGRSRLGEGKY